MKLPSEHAICYKCLSVLTEHCRYNIWLRNVRDIPHFCKAERVRQKRVKGMVLAKLLAILW